MSFAEADHSFLSSAVIKNAWICISTPQYIFMAWYLVKHRNNLTYKSCSWKC